MIRCEHNCFCLMKFTKDVTDVCCQCVLSLLLWEFCYLWIVWENTKDFRYCFQVLIPAEVEIIYSFPVMNHYLSIFVCFCMSWTNPIINIFPNAPYLSIFHIFTTAIFHYFEYTFNNIQHFKHNILR